MASDLAGIADTYRVEYHRRVDCCQAVIASLVPIVERRAEHEDDLKRARYFVDAKWPFATLLIAGLMYWLGDALEVGALRGIGAVVGLLVVAGFVNAAIADSRVSAQLRQADTQVADLRFHWLAAGGSWDEFSKYCELVRNSGGSPGFEDHVATMQSVRAAILERVLGARG